jgi:hypothetical protein
MRRLALIACLVVLAVPSWAADTGPAFRPTAHITSQATTHLVTDVAGTKVTVLVALICVDAGGAAAGVALQDTAGTNIFGSGVVWVIPIGGCLTLPAKPNNAFWGQPTASGKGLDIVTTVGNGPVEVYLEVRQQ